MLIVGFGGLILMLILMFVMGATQVSAKADRKESSLIAQLRRDGLL